MRAHPHLLTANPIEMFQKAKFYQIYTQLFELYSNYNCGLKIHTTYGVIQGSWQFLPPPISYVGGPILKSFKVVNVYRCFPYNTCLKS